jgi:hypothetical protein
MHRSFPMQRRQRPLEERRACRTLSALRRSSMRTPGSSWRMLETCPSSPSPQRPRSEPCRPPAPAGRCTADRHGGACPEGMRMRQSFPMQRRQRPLQERRACRTLSALRRSSTRTPGSSWRMLETCPSSPSPQRPRSEPCRPPAPAGRCTADPLGGGGPRPHPLHKRLKLQLWKGRAFRERQSSAVGSAAWSALVGWSSDRMPWHTRPSRCPVWQHTARNNWHNRDRIPPFAGQPRMDLQPSRQL